MATIAIKIAVTTWPRPRSLGAPTADIGATGCSTIIPYKIKSHRVSARRNLGAAAVTVASAPKHLSFQPAILRSIQSFQTPPFCVNRLNQASAIFRLRIPTRRLHAILIFRHAPLRPTLRIHRGHNQKERKGQLGGGLSPHHTGRRVRSRRPLPVRSRFPAPRRARSFHRLLNSPSRGRKDRKKGFHGAGPSPSPSRRPRRRRRRNPQ